MADLFRGPPSTADDWPEDEIPAGFSVRDLFAPLSLDGFIDQHLAKRPFVGGVQHDFVANLFSLREFRDAVSRHADLAGGELLKVIFDHGESVDGRIGSSRPRFVELPTLLWAGATLCVTDLHRSSNKLRAIAEHLKHALSWVGPCGVNAYLSTGDSGFARHFDARNVTTLQLAGEKRWIYSSQPAVMFPQRNAAVRATGPVYAGSVPADWETFFEEPGARDEQEVILEPGHILTLPAGTWHAARANGYSLAINVYFRHESFTAVVNRFLEQTLDPNPQWRGGVPAFPRGQLEGELRGYLKDRIQEMAALLESLESDPGPLLDCVYAALSTASSHAAPPPPAAEPLAKTDLLRVRRPDLLWVRPYDGPGGRRLAVYHDGEVFQMDAGVEDFMLHLCAQRVLFRADSCCDWTNDDSAYPWDDVKALLESLLVRGIVVRDDRAAGAVR